jgi:hypothetical protein
MVATRQSALELRNHLQWGFSSYARAAVYVDRILKETGLPTSRTELEQVRANDQPEETEDA